MQTKQALVVVVGTALLVLLTLSPKAVDMTNPPRIPNHPPQDTNCYTAYTTTNCTEGSITLANLAVVPAEGCVGIARNAVWSPEPSNGVVVVITTCTNANGGSCTNCPAPQTNAYEPTLLSYSWTVGGVQATPASGEGASVTFVPNSAGTGVFTL